MEKRLKQLFDFQDFEENARLRAVIQSVKARYGIQELSEDDLERVAAAGAPGYRHSGSTLLGEGNNDH